MVELAERNESVTGVIGAAGVGVDVAVPAGEDADPDLPEVPDRAQPVNEAKRHGVVAVLRFVLPVLVGVGVIFVGFASAGGVREAAGLIRHVRVRWLWLAAACEVGQFAALTMHVSYLAGPKTNTRRVGPARTALVVFGLGAVLPAAPAEGLAMAGTAMNRRGLARRRTVLVLGLSQWFSNAALYLVAAVSALVFVSLSGLSFGDDWVVVLAAAATVAFLAAATFLATRSGTAEWVAVGWARLRWWRKPRPSHAESRNRGAAWHAAAAHVVSGPRGVVVLGATAVAAWVADAMCLHVALLAFGVHVSLVVLLFAYSVGTLAAAIPFLPAGIGAVETAIPAVLALARVPAHTSLAAIVIYRAFSTILPAVAGLIAWVGLRLETAPAELQLALDEERPPTILTRPATPAA